MKKTVALFLFQSFILTNCSKKDCMQASKCFEQPESGVTCDAYWESWIYHSQKNKCEFIDYSGCSPLGFDTQAECEKCECEE